MGKYDGNVRNDLWENMMEMEKVDGETWKAIDGQE